MRLLSLVLCAPLALSHITSHAQGDPVLRDKEVNEATLIEALTPERTFRTRSIRISPDSAPAAPAKKPSASMLITFETASAVLKPQSRKMLDSLGRAMTSDKLSTYKFAIEGHADPRGTEAANLELSQRRAEAVVSYLTENHRIDASRLRPVGKGQSELFNLTQVDAPENRRVTVKTLLE